MFLTLSLTEFNDWELNSNLTVDTSKCYCYSVDSSNCSKFSKKTWFND